MTLRHLFSRQSRLALVATPKRAILTWGVVLCYEAASWIWPMAMPWWGWVTASLLGIVGFAILGRRWADKDLGASDPTGEG